MATRTAGATFEAASFAWARGKFTLIGTWTGAEGLGAVFLHATIDGTRERMEAEGNRVAEDGPRWGARFRADSPPDADTPVALELAGREFTLPEPHVTAPEAGRFARTDAFTPPPPPAPPEPARSAAPASAAPSPGAAAAEATTAIQPAVPARTVPHAPAVPTTETVMPDDGTEVSELRELLHELRHERRAVETAIQRLAQERAAAEKAALALPRRTPLPPLKPLAKSEKDEDVDYAPAYWVGAFVLLLFFIVLIWIF
jgi:hypothetical protein